MYFWVTGAISCWGVFQGVIFHREGSFQVVNFSGEIVHWGDLTEYLRKTYLYILLFLFRLNFTHGVVMNNCPRLIFARVELSRVVLSIRVYAYPRGYANPSQGIREGSKIILVYSFITPFCLGSTLSLQSDSPLCTISDSTSKTFVSIDLLVVARSR